jgi:hypothetical protein
LTEFIWNSVGADAFKFAVRIEQNELGALPKCSPSGQVAQNGQIEERGRDLKTNEQPILRLRQEAMELDFATIRRLIITALFADDKLMDKLVLKGGNALSLVYSLSKRTSLDLDFSIEKDFEDVDEVRQLMFRTLQDRFDSAGYVVFDLALNAKPRLEGPDAMPWWGGYELSFKVIDKQKQQRLKSRLDKQRIDALVIGPNQERTFKVDLSKYEFVEGKVAKELDYYTIYVYPPAMIAIEKLRAICQQMPEYEIKDRGTARARDFYDIHLILTNLGVLLIEQENQELIQNVFAAKKVPLRLLGLINQQREFHRPDWPAVVSSVDGKVEDFDFYFDFVVDEVDRLKALWIKES